MGRLEGDEREGTVRTFDGLCQTAKATIDREEEDGKISKQRTINLQNDYLCGRAMFEEKKALNVMVCAMDMDMLCCQRRG